MNTYGLGFRDWVYKECAYHENPIEDFRVQAEKLDGGVWIGVDAEEYLAEHLAVRAEPLIPALGGLPFSLKAKVDEDIELFKQVGISLHFVFNGLEYTCRDRANILKASNRSFEALDHAWKVYDAGRADDSVSAFGVACEFTATSDHRNPPTDFAQARIALRKSSKVCRLICTARMSCSRSRPTQPPRSSWSSDELATSITSGDPHRP